MKWADELNATGDSDPTKYGGTNDNPYRLQPAVANDRVDGFSQAYSPSSSNTFGGYSPVPIHVYTYLRNEAGDNGRSNILIFANAEGLTNSGWPYSLAPISVGQKLQLEFKSTENPPTGGSFEEDLIRTAMDTRRTLASVFDDAGIFKLGSARYRTSRINGTTTDEGNLYVDLVCIEEGRAPTHPYETLEIEQPEQKQYFYLKAITRIEEASYSTVSACNIVDIALKAQIYRRISGRQQTYGSQARPGYAASDNGMQQRTSMFLLHYRIAGSTSWSTVAGIFAVRRAAEQDNYIYIKFNGGSTPQNWQFRFEPIIDPISEVTKYSFMRQSDGLVRYFYLQNSGNPAGVDLGSGQTMYFTGFVQTSQVNGLPPLNDSPRGTNEWDWFSLDADTQLQTSFERGPELAITAVSEQLTQNFTSSLYSNLALVGFNVFSGKSLQDMRSFSAFVTGGKPVRRLRTYGTDENGNFWGSPSYNYYPSNPDGPTSFAPDIFLDTVLDPQDGIGNYAKINGIDIRQLAIAKRFCRTNNLFMDALIADRQNWRSFWAANAPFSLLEFARIGGRETLIPSVPYDELTGAIQRQIQVSALFNQGNILEDSYKEEFLDYDANVQDIIATVIYRSLDSNGTFAVNRSITIQRSDTSAANAILQSFDASAFVANEDQAILFGKLMCNTRRYVRSAIEFKTFPTTSPISPGSYIYVDIGHNSWDGITTGVIGPGGKLNSPVDNTVRNGSYSFLLYQSGNGVVQTTATVTDNTAPELATREGYLYVLGTKVKSRRVFRVNEVQMDEEGEVTVRGTIFPCDAGDNSLIADFSDNLFTIQR